MSQGANKDEALNPGLPLGSGNSLTHASEPLTVFLPPSEDSPTIVSKKGTNDSSPSKTGMEALLKGAKIAHFELIGPLGSGGMAAVLLARDTQLDRQVALKILPPEAANDPDSVQRFHQEARSAAKLDHEHIVRVFFCGEDQGLHFIAFEYVEGETLRALFDRKGRLDSEESLLYLEQLCQALDHASERGVVHRDIKPSNILITPQGKAKLLDMGLARSFGHRDNGLTQSGVTLGTFDYISPEQALDPRTADSRSDIYSLGCTMYHVLTGNSPVPSGPAAMKLAHHQQIMPPDPREVVPGLDPKLVRLVADMMAKDPAQRPQTPAELLALVRGIRSHAPSSKRFWRSPRAVWPGKVPARSVDGSTRLAVGSLGLAIVLFVGALFANSFRNPIPLENDPASGEPAPRRSAADVRAQVARWQPLVPTLAELSEWLAKQQPGAELELILAGDLDISGSENSKTNLAIQAKRVTIRAADPARPARILYRHRGTTPLGGNIIALEISAETIELSDVHFVADARLANESIEALKLKPRREAHLRRCVFQQARPSMDDRQRFASLRLDNPDHSDNSEPIVRLQECVFLGFGDLNSQILTGGSGRLSLIDAKDGGQDAIVRTGDLDLYFEQCAIGPHQRLLTLGPASGRQETAVRMTQCTAILGPKSEFFCVDPLAHPAISLGYSLVASMDEVKTGNQKTQAILIRILGQVGQLTFRGVENRYHRIDQFLAEEGTPAISHLDQFRNTLALRALGEDDSRILESSPWRKPGAFETLALDINENNKAEALHLQAERIAAVFAVKDRVRDLRPDDNPTNRLVGAERCGSIDFLVDKLPPFETKSLVVQKPMDKTGTKTRIVDPDMDDPTKGIYSTLEQAIVSSRPGDEILIRHQGPLRTKSVRIDDPDQSLVIRAHPGFSPILTLQAVPEEHASLFRLDGASLRLEELEFALEAGQNGLKSLSLAALGRPGTLALKRCSVTLDASRKVLPMALVTMLDTQGLMRMDEMEPRHWRIDLDQTVLRGAGNVLTNPVGRPVELDARQSLFSLDGSILAVDSPGFGTKLAEGAEGVILRWTRNTSWLSGPFLKVHAIGGQLVPPVFAKVNESLVAMSPGKSLIRMEGISGDAPMEKLPEKLHWEASGNTYANMVDMVEAIGPDSMVVRKSIGGAQWIAATHEVSPRWLATLDPPGQTMMMAAIPYSRWTPRDLLAWKALAIGADLDSLPTPTTAPRRRE